MEFRYQLTRSIILLTLHHQSLLYTATPKQYTISQLRSVLKHAYIPHHDPLLKKYTPHPPFPPPMTSLKSTPSGQPDLNPQAYKSYPEI
jgi:hypothetical protein